MASTHFFALFDQVWFEIELIAHLHKSIRETRLSVLWLVTTILETQHQTLIGINWYLGNRQTPKTLIIDYTRKWHS